MKKSIICLTSVMLIALFYVKVIMTNFLLLRLVWCFVRWFFRIGCGMIPCLNWRVA